MKSKTITITITNKCNLQCVYCYEKNKNTDSIDERKLYEIIDKEMSLRGNDEKLIFNLFGGEPFLEFGLIKEAYNYLDNKYDQKNWEIGLITNGTLIDGQTKSWLKKRKDQIVCTLSIDGTKDVHDRNRSNSFDLIDLDFFVKTFKQPYAKMTVSEYTLENLSESIIFLHNKGFQINCSIGYGFKWTQEMIKKLDSELKKYYTFAYENYNNITDCSLLNLPFEDIFDSKDIYYRNCDAGDNTKAYDTIGESYPCHMFLPNGLSKKEIEEIKTITFPDNIVNDELVSNRCKGCALFSVCLSCFANNYRMNKNIYKQDIGICSVTKILFKRRADFFSELWINHKLDLKDVKQEYKLLDTISRINDMEINDE